MAQHDDQKDNKRKVDAEAQVGVGLKNKLPRRSQRQSASSACAKTEEESGVDVKPGVDTSTQFKLEQEASVKGEQNFTVQQNPPSEPTPASRTNDLSSRPTGSPTKDASTSKAHADTAQDDTVIALSSDDEGFEMIKEREIIKQLFGPKKLPVPVKTERNIATSGLTSSGRAVLGSIDNTPTRNSVPSYGGKMKLSDWCTEYEVPDTVKEKLIHYGLTTPFAVAGMNAQHFHNAKIADGELLTVTGALECWRRDAVDATKRQQQVRTEQPSSNHEHAAFPGVALSHPTTDDGSATLQDPSHAKEESAP
ncbi:hypothetical protein CF328_g8063 [Tilletia controversa]|nr:hypothetical protein CF328_g8063 [Tilletia controversa]